MRRLFNIGYDSMLSCALLLLLALNFFAAYSENLLFLNLSKVMFIPLLLIAFFLNNKTLNLAFIAFLLFSFFGDAFGLFLIKDSDINGANMMFFLSYICLIVIGIHKFKFVNIDKVIGVYLLGILLINGYFLFTLCHMFSALITDGLEMILFGAKSMTLILLVFISFAVYLSNQTKASILFLMMAIAFVFSDILNYVIHYYAYNWSILMIDRWSHIIGLFFAFKYIIETNKASSKVAFMEGVGEKNFSMDNILA